VATAASFAVAATVAVTVAARGHVMAA